MEEQRMARQRNQYALIRYVVYSLVLLMTAGLLRLSAEPSGNPNKDDSARDTKTELKEGKQTFRFDTFGSEDFWGGKLRLHEAIEGAKLGGVGAGVSPNQALALGLKVDLDAVPKAVGALIKKGKVDLNDPATTLILLKA